MKKNIVEGKFKINLQLFGDEGGTPPANEGEEGNGEKGTGEEGAGEEKSFTQEELNQKIKERLAREKVKFEEEYKTKLALEKKEAERLAKLGEDEREKEILRTAKEEFETERLTFQREKLELQVTKELAEKGLPITFANLLVTDDADTSLENIKSFEKDWQDALERAVTEKLKGTSPKAGGTIDSEGSGLGKRLAEQRQRSQEVIENNPYF